MNALTIWRENVARNMDADWDDMEEDDELMELLFFSGPFTAQNSSSSWVEPVHGGSRPGRSANVRRNRAVGHDRLFQDYFASNPTYGELTFRRRYRMSSRLFVRIMDVVSQHDNYFLQRRDVAHVPGLSPHQKVIVAIRQLAYGIGTDATDEYYRIGESTALEALYRFSTTVREVFELVYLRRPTPADFAKQLNINQERGFPGMFGSLDCMHWVWKNCPYAWQGSFTNKDKHKSIILEAIADQELWIWHAFFGLAGGNNDLNVLDRSPLLNEWVHNDSGNITFHVNGVQYNKAYLLVDGIYPPWSMFISTIHLPQTEKLKYFARCPEGARKDVERAFGVLQGRFHIVKQPARSWYQSRLIGILYYCVIPHNMIVEDERDEDFPAYFNVIPPTVERRPLSWAQFLASTVETRHQDNHFKLRGDIVEHLWARKGVGHVDHL